MNKLKLRLDDLRVETFDTAAGEKEKGTVLGHQPCTCPTACTCPGCPTCDETCPETCAGLSCPYSCDYSCQIGTCQATCQNFAGAPCTWGQPMECYF
jgi:hypothetical protein